MKTFFINLFTKTKVDVFELLFQLGRLTGTERRTVRVLCYHSIGTSENRYSVGISDFKDQILELLKYYRFISLDDVVEKSYLSDVRPSIALTIDDGYADILKVLPFLRKHSIPVAVFVLSDSKRVQRKELDHSGKLLTVSQVRTLARSGVTIGSHSATHMDLTQVSLSQLRQELYGSKKNLEENIGMKVKYFAYPKGLFNKAVITYVKKAGYRAAFSVLPGIVNRSSNQFLLPRIVITSNHSIFEVPVLVSNTALFIRNVYSRFVIHGEDRSL